MNYTAYLKYIFLSILLLGSFQVEASIINGSIDPTNHTAQVCENAPCTISGTSPVNFGVFTTTPASNVVVTDTALSGYLWGKSFGWVVLNCVNTTSGCSATNGNFKVSNDYNGHLYGYAWGEDTGWINFGTLSAGVVTFSNSATAPVTINSAGEFNGYAWAQNFGWIKFDCTNPSYCVKTDWRPRNTRPQCSDGLDNDSDGQIDSNDSGCITGGVYDPTDTLEYVNHGGGGGGDGCTVNCNPPPFCTLHPTDPSCIPPTFCSLHPTDLSCVTPTFCTLHPTDPSCQPPSFCTLHPTDPSCIPPTFCSLHPTDLSCVTPTFCTLHPTDPSCIPPPPVCTGPNCNPPPPPCTGLGCIAPPPVKKTINSISGILDTPKATVITQTVTTVGALAGVVLSFSTALFANPLTFSEMFLIPIRLWSLLLSALGLKKRNRPWGIVYDSVTKQPLDPAYVILQDLQGNEVTTSITDLDGRYGFLVPAGQYRMSAHKTNYEFPSRKLSGKSGDELYADLYFNEIITVTEGGVITKNIPMDPLNFDWNEFAKKDQRLMKFYSKRDVIMARLSNVLFYIGFALTTVAVLVTPKLYNTITFGVYIVLFILKHTVLKPRPFGRLQMKATGNPLSFAVIKVYVAGLDHEITKKVADKTGKYYCLIPNGNYYVKIEVKNQDESYTPIYTSDPFEVKNGYINKKFEI